MIPLLMMNVERHFIRYMEPWGVTTRGGKKIGWNEFTRVTRARGGVKELVLSDEYLLDSPKGKVSLPLWRAMNAQEARDFLVQYLPSSLLGGL
jgi:hypothetical protein